MAVGEKVYTADDLWQLSHEADDRRLELIEGELHEMTPAGEAHGVTTLTIGARVLIFVQANDLGRVTAAETGYVLYKNPDPNGKDTVLAPDVGFISKARMTEKPTEKYVPVAPDLAIEVVSPSETYTKIARKVALYLRYGTRLVWVFDPATRTVAAHTPGGSKIYEAGDTLDGGDVLPGFKLDLSEVWGK